MYTNPLTYDDGVERTNPDPFVIRHRGRYWCYSSDERGVNVSTSPDLVTWRSEGPALEVPGQQHYWAPCVIYAEGRFWMYVSFRSAGSDDPHDELLHVAVADSPAGPFTVQRRLFDTFSIDPHVVRDPHTGRYVMFYSTNDITGLEVDGTGTSILVDYMLAMDQPAGRPRHVVVPTLEEEIFERNRFGDGRDWYTIEGASYFTRRGTAFLTYSGNAYVGEDYFIGYSRATLDGGPGELSWTKHPDDHHWDPLVRRNDSVEGTGHNSIVRAPNLVDDWIVYHGRDADIPLVLGREQRVMRIDPLHYDGNRLTTPAPTASPQPAPAQPSVFEDFAAGALDSAWTVLAGSGDVVGPEHANDDGALRTSRDLLTLIAHEQQVGSYVAEVYLRAERSDAGARCGISPVLHDADNRVTVLLDAATSALQITRAQRGIVTVLAQVPVPDLDLSMWHHLELERVVDHLTIHLDGVELATVVTGTSDPARVGLVSVGTTTEFSALTLTEHVDLWGERLTLLPHLYRADRHVEVTGGAVGSRSRRPVVLDGDQLTPAVTLVHEVEILAAYGYATLDLVSPEVTLRVRYEEGQHHVAIVRDGVAQPVAVSPHERPTAALRAVVRDGAVHLNIGGRYYTVDVDLDVDITPRLELAGSLLHGVQLTSLPPNRE